MNINDYDERILGVLGEATQPMDVEKIRSESGIGHWNTALSHCLELLLNKRIFGTKTTKSWVFWVNKEVAKVGQ